MKQREALYRPDIDGLRAIAVLAVVAYHYAPSHFPGGFIGVDIFFVISGYLITGILARQFETRTFSLLRFYERRIRRIFPALALILGFSLVSGWLLLYSFEFATLGKHIAASAGFIQNVLLWQEAGYFDADAIEKPLLHLWSLSVEEQFYIVWPLVLWLVLRTGWRPMGPVAVIASVSFGLNIWGLHLQKEMAVFYLPFARAWELMFGAWLSLQHQTSTARPKFSSAQSIIGLTLICVGFAVIRPADFPGLWGLIPVLGAAFIINAGPSSLVNKWLLTCRPMVWVGLISYPLYLWHWTLLSFVVIAFGDNTEESLLTGYKTIAAGLSVILAWATFRYIEQPVRTRRSEKITLVLMFITLSLGIAGFVVYLNKGLQARPFSFVSSEAETYVASISRSPHARDCFDLTTDATLPVSWSCTLGLKDSETWIAAFGDSHALSLIPALDHYGKATGVRVIFAGLSGCPPLLGVYSARPTGAACRELVQNMTSKASIESAAAIILVGRWTYYTGGTTRPNEIQHIYIDNEEKVSGLQAFRHGLNTTLQNFDDHNIPVVLIRDNPQQVAAIPKGADRFARELHDSIFNATAVTLDEHHRNQFQVNEVLRSAAARYRNVSMIDFDSVLCTAEYCPWVKNGKFLYFDDDHLSIAGAMEVHPVLSDHLNRILSSNGN